MQNVNLEKLPLQARLEILDFYEFLLNKYTNSEVNQTKTPLISYKSTLQPRIGDLATTLFGMSAGIDLDLPQYIPHQALEFEQ